MRRAYKFLLRPTTKQAQAMFKCVEAHRQREGRRWFVVLACDEVPERHLPGTGCAAGIDMGVVSFLTTSDGVRIPNPRHLSRSRDRLAASQQALSRCKPDSEDGYAPNGATAKAGLKGSILDTGWGMFLSILSAKAESAGRLVIAVNARNTSRTCPECAHCAQNNRVTQADFTCTRCGYTGHADVVGARNVLHRAGLALQSAKAS